MLNKLFVLIIITITTSFSCVYAGPQSRTLTSNQVKNIIDNMNSEKATAMALSGNLGECRAYSNADGASSVYSLKWSNNGSEEVGPSLIMPVKSVLIDTTVTTSVLRQAALQAPTNSMVSSSRISEILKSSARSTLGAKLIQLLKENKCGDIGFSTTQVNFKDLNASNVQFYRDEKDELVCSSQSFENEIRDPSTCQMKPITTFLPYKVCRFIYQVARTKGNVNVGKTSQTSSSNRNRFIAIGPKISPFTDEIKKARDLDLVIRDRSNLDALELVQSVRIPPAELYLPSNILDRLKDTNLQLNNFEALPLQVKSELSEFVINYEATQGKSDLPEWSSEFRTIYSNIKPNVELFLQTNTSQNLNLYHFPKTEITSNAINDKILPFIKAGLPAFKHDSCKSVTRLPPIKFNPGILQGQKYQIPSTLLNNLYQAKFDDLKINQALTSNPIPNLPLSLVRSSSLLQLQEIPTRSISSTPQVNTTPVSSPNPTQNPNFNQPVNINLDDFEF